MVVRGRIRNYSPRQLTTPSSNSKRAIAKRLFNVGTSVARSVARGLASSSSFTKAITKKKRKRKTSRIPHDHATYAGRFAKPRGTDRIDGRFGTKGAICIAESVGQILDRDCVYLGHASHAAYYTVRTALLAVLRTLIKGGTGWDCNDLNDTIPDLLSASADSTGLRLTVTLATEGTTTEILQAYDYDFTSGVTLNFLCGGSNRMPIPGGASANTWFGAVNIGTASAGNVLLEWLLRYYQPDSSATPKQMRLWRKDNNAGDSWKLINSIDLENVMVHMRSKSTLKIQNRTVTVATDNESDDVNAVPLTGRVYDFKSYNARCVTQQLFESTDVNTGLVTVRSEDCIPASRGFSEPPVKQVFRNCAKVGTLMLQPGTIKEDTLVFKKSAYLPRLFQLLYLYTEDPVLNSAATNTRIGMGQMRLFALEKFINMIVVEPTTPKITLVYENNLWAGAYVTIKKRPIMLQSYETRAVSTL